MQRREFLKLSLFGLTAVAVGNVKIPYGFVTEAHAATNTINLTMMEAMVEMVDKNPVYHWVYSTDVENASAASDGVPRTPAGMFTPAPPTLPAAGGVHPNQGIGPSLPGPVIFATAGDTLTLNITNNLPANTPHAFQIVGTKIKTGPIPPGGKTTITFTVPDGGTYMYIDPLNAPINRVMGLAGCLVSLPPFAPRARTAPYSKPTPTVQQIFNDLGTTAELPPNQADVTKYGRGGWFADLDIPDPRYRIWFVTSTDPALHTRIQNGDMPTAAEFRATYVAMYQMINGRGGGYCTSHPEIKPSLMIGQPCLIRFLNAGMAQHSAHIHGNHVLVLSVNNEVQDNVFSIDTWHMRPLDRVDWLLPYRMPPDIPNRRNDAANSGANVDPANIINKNGAVFRVPPTGILRTNSNEELKNRPGGQPWPTQRPAPYPMHCHSEISQSAAGGNYPAGMVTHWEITGDIDGVSWLDPALVASHGLGPDDAGAPFFDSAPIP
jgi:hypothetical protein